MGWNHLTDDAELSIRVKLSPGGLRRRISSRANYLSMARFWLRNIVAEATRKVRLSG